MRTVLAFVLLLTSGGGFSLLLSPAHELRHNSIRRPRRCIIIPSGCAESSAPTHLAHLLAWSAHLEMRTVLAFLCCCGHLPVRRSDPVGSLSYYHQLTNFHTSMPQRRIVIPSGCAKSACLKHSAYPLGLSAHLEMRTLLTFGCGGGPRASSDPVGSLSYYHQLTKETITRCPSVASLYRVDALNALLLGTRRIQLPGRRISKGENYWLFCVVVDIWVSSDARSSPFHQLTSLILP
jgi:hypothetical protein